MSIKKLGSTKLTDDVLVSSVNLASEVTGILGVANGGTGQSVFTNGQLLIGNTTGNTLTKATLTAGSGISITNGAGSITIANTAQTQWSTNGSDIYYNGGNVGIGTASPGAKLEVTNGDIWLNATSESVNPELRFVDGAGIGVAGLKIRYGNNDGNAYFDHMWDVASSGFYFRNRVNGTPVNTLTMLNGLVGINNTSPIAPLSFANTAGNKIDLYHATGGSGDRYGFAVEANVLRIFQGAVAEATGGIVFGRSSTATFTEYARFSTGGSFLLGDTIRPSEGGVWNGTAVFGINGSNKVIAGYLNSSTTGAYIGGHNSAMTDWADLNVAGKDIIFRFNQTERMRLDGANGRLGILTSSPAGSLDVRVSGIGTWDRFVVTQTNLWGDGTTEYVTIGAGNAAGIMIYNPHVVWNSGNSAAAIRLGRSGGVSTGVWYEIGTKPSDAFWISRNAGATPQFYIDSSDNIGITTATPTGRIGIAIPNYTASATAGMIRFQNPNSSADSCIQSFFVDGAGSEIVLGNNFYFNTAGSTARFSASYPSAAVHPRRDGSIGFLTSTSAANATAKVTITAAGNMGIGADSPLARLSVGAGSLSDGNVPVQISTQAATGLVYFGANKNGGYGALFGYDNNGFGGAVVRNVVTGEGISFVVNNSTEVMRITGDNTIGIGTTATYNGSTFEIRRNGIWNGPVITLYQTGTGGQAWSMFSTNASFSQGAGKLLFYNGTGAGDVAVLTPEGNMGLGVMTPQNSSNYKTLSVGGTSGGQIAFHVNNTANAFIYNSNSHFDIYNGANGPMRFYTNGNLRATIDNGGNVGIGTTSPGQKVHIESGSLLVNTGTGSGDFRDIMVGGLAGWSINEAHGIEMVYNTATSPGRVGRFDCNLYDGTNSRAEFRWGRLYAGGESTSYVMFLKATGTTTANLSVSGTLTGTDFILSSDRRRKTELVRISDALAKVLEWAGYTYRPIDGERRRAGLMAQDVEVNAPEVVYTDDDGWKSMSYEQTIPYLVEAIRDLHRMVEALA